MGRALAERYAVCRATFAEADAALGEPLSRLIFDGPADTLTLTEHAQPAILTMSIAASRLLDERGLKASYVAGHSLGEYSAHVAAGTLEFADAVRLVRNRGRYMQEAVPVGEGAMAAVLGLDEAGVAQACLEGAQGEVVSPANLNAPGQIVIAGATAAIARDQLMLRLKRADWDEVIATNLTASFSWCQAVLKPMIRQRAGRIVAISSVVGQMGNAGQANYAASKAGLIGFCKALAREVASRNITVNVVAPGLIGTDMTKAIAEQAKGDWAAQIPMGRMGTPDDVAAAVRFLASDEASYITGQVLAVNGGMYM
jgi:NAD(P)-dependent dehydrogenase (short-subunit alcohol dehydrogenase family)